MTMILAWLVATARRLACSHAWQYAEMAGTVHGRRLLVRRCHHCGWETVVYGGLAGGEKKESSGG